MLQLLTRGTYNYRRALQSRGLHLDTPRKPSNVGNPEVGGGLKLCSAMCVLIISFLRPSRGHNYWCCCCCSPMCPEPETIEIFLDCNKTISDLNRTINDCNSTVTVWTNIYSFGLWWTVSFHFTAKKHIPPREPFLSRLHLPTRLHYTALFSRQAPLYLPRVPTTRRNS